MRSLYSAISGMRSHMTYMDVVGNNIANVNTTSFKGARVVFSDILGQTVKQATTPTPGGRGGTNSSQVGLGTSVAGINVQMMQGNLMSTGKGTDLAIQGEGFFVVSDGNISHLSRDGALDLDSEGTMVNMNSGMRVRGWMATYPGAVYTAPVVTDSEASLTDISLIKGMGKDGSAPGAVPGRGGDARFLLVGGNGAVTGVYSDGSNQVVAQLAIATVTNSSGLNRAGQNNWLPSQNSGAVTYGQGDTPGRGTIVTGTLEGSNVDLAAEFGNLIIAQRGFQANTRVISAADQVLQDLVNIVR